MSLHRSVVVILLAATALVACGCRRDSGSTRTIKLAHVLTDKHPVHKAMVRMAALVQSKTDGSLAVDVRHSAQLGAEIELLEKTRAGSIQMTKISSNALEKYVDEMGIYAMPFLFRDEEHYWKVLDGEIGREIMGKLESVGLKGLVYYDAGARSFYSRGELTKFEDLAGMKIRVQESPTMRKMVEAMGAIPVTIPFGPPLTQALDKGVVVQGAENNPPSYYNQGHHRYCPYYLLDRHSRAPDVLVMNLDAWNSLSDDEKAALTEAARESATYQRKLWDQEVEKLFGKLTDEGVTITREFDREPFFQATAGLYDSLPEERRTWVQKIRSAQ